MWEAIKVIIETAMDVIKGIIETVTAIISGDWERAWEGIKGIFVSIWEGMKELLPALLEGLYNIIKLSFSVFKDLGKNMFNMVWEGMKGIWKSISNWVSDKVSWLIDKLAFWRKSKSEMEEDDDDNDEEPKKKNGSHAGGLNYVPFDGYVAELHKGERVLTANESREYSQGTNLKTQPIILQVINQGTVVGTNGMKEFAKMVSAEISDEYGLSTGGAW